MDDLFRVNHSKRLFFDEYGAKVVEGNFVLFQDHENYTIKCQWVSSGNKLGIALNEKPVGYR